MSNAMFENDIVFNTSSCFYGDYSFIKCQNCTLGVNLYKNGLSNQVDETKHDLLFKENKL
jgi:hypothetical protein